MWLPRYTYIFAILGSEARECTKRKKLRPDEGKHTKNSWKDTNEISDLNSKIILSSKSELLEKGKHNFVEIKTNKYKNYYLTAHGILLKRLAKYYGIPDENVLIMAKGKKENFYVHELTNNKLYIQLNKTEIFKTDVKEDEIDFIFFDQKYGFAEIPEIIKSIRHKENAHILFFLDGHGTHNEFAGMPYLNLYLPFYKFPHNSLRVFNDGCRSHKMIEVIERFFIINNVIKNETSGKGIDIINIEYIAKLASEYDQKQQLSSIQGEIAKLESIYHKNIPSLPDNEQKLTIIRIAVTELDDIITKENQNLLPYFEEFEFLKPKREIFSKLGLFKLSDLFIFKKIYKILGCPIGDFCDTVKIFNERNYRIAAKIYKRLDCKTSDDLFHIINDIRNQCIERSVDFSFGKFLASLHDDHVIVTTSPSNGVDVAFGTKRIKGSDVKVTMGTPGFGSFIGEVFLNVTPEKISVVNGMQTEEDKMEEFDEKKSVQRMPNGEHIKKQWNKPRIKVFSTENISNERIFRDSLLGKPPNRIEILKDIGFNLVQEIESDGEPPNDPKNDLFVESKYRSRVRYVDNVFGPEEMVKDKSTVSIKYLSEDDEYYSDDDVYDTSYIRSSASMSTSEEEEGKEKDVELTEEEANKIIEELNIPKYGWNADMHLFITASLQKKTKKMKYPFDPNKKDNFNGINFNWARNTLRGYFPICEIFDATKLILSISDFAYLNELECISLEEPVSKLIQSICRIGSKKIPRFRDQPKL